MLCSLQPQKVGMVSLSPGNHLLQALLEHQLLALVLLSDPDCPPQLPVVAADHDLVDMGLQ